MTACYRCQAVAVAGVYDPESDDTAFECTACGALQPWQGEDEDLRRTRQGLRRPAREVLTLAEQGMSERAIALQVDRPAVWVTGALERLRRQGLLPSVEQERTVEDLTREADWIAAARSRYAECERQLAAVAGIHAEMALLKRVLAMAGDGSAPAVRRARRWTEQEDALLWRMKEEGQSRAATAAAMDRTVSAIMCRLIVLRARRKQAA